MNRKKLIITVIVLAAILLLLVAAIFLLDRSEHSDQPETTASADTANTSADTSADTAGESASGTSEAPVVTTAGDTASGTTDPDETVTAGQSQQNPGQTTTPATDAPAVTQPQTSDSLQFPYKIPGTSLVIEQIESYDGIFLEDGSDSDVSGITVIILTNTGSTCAEYAAITLTQGSRTLNFKATGLAAGCTAVVQESSAAAYQTGAYTACTADVAELEKLEMSENLVSVTENANGSLTVKNLTNQEIPCVRIFYKFCMDPGSVYVGGITYTARIVNLKAGASQEVTPSHYAAGYSEVIMVRTYDTVD